MSRLLSFSLVVVALVLAFGWSARAGDESAVEKRLADVERRLTAIETLLGGAPADLPRLLQARRAANEVAAIATMRNVVSAEAQLQASSLIDEDQDGVGEYGGFAEMSGASRGRMARPLVPPVLSPAFRVLDDEGEVTRNGYCFRVFIAGKDGEGVGEPQTGFAPGGSHDPEASEVVWCCYAWPVLHGTSGTRTFFVNQEGDVLATEAAAYSGEGRGPRADAAFQKRGTVTGPTASGARGADGNLWEPL
jgi:hypothetical protein